MESVYRRRCGIDVHQKSVSVCVLPPAGSQTVAVKEEAADVVDQLPGDRDGEAIVPVHDRRYLTDPIRRAEAILREATQ